MSGRDTVFKPSTATNPGGASSGQGGLWYPKPGAPGGFVRKHKLSLKQHNRASTAAAAVAT